MRRARRGFLVVVLVVIIVFVRVRDGPQPWGEHHAQSALWQPRPAREYSGNLATSGRNGAGRGGLGSRAHLQRDSTPGSRPPASKRVEWAPGSEWSRRRARRNRQRVLQRLIGAASPPLVAVRAAAARLPVAVAHDGAQHCGPPNDSRRGRPRDREHVYHHCFGFDLGLNLRIGDHDRRRPLPHARGVRRPRVSRGTRLPVPPRVGGAVPRRREPGSVARACERARLSPARRCVGTPRLQVSAGPRTVREAPSTGGGRDARPRS